MLYDNYTTRIKSIVSQNRNGITPDLNDIILNRSLIRDQRLFSARSHLKAEAPIKEFLNPEVITGKSIGNHPDFAHLRGTDKTELHYIVSAFIDIKGSTNLFGKYSLTDIYRITNTIQGAAIHTCLAVGGHIQRLQGDGVFAYFGGKNIKREEAVDMALTACSMICYFVKNDLSNLFLEDGIENIKTRIGIDIGDDNDVLWANFGIDDVSELTTLSLHTSLASKMQVYAEENGMVVGDNIKDIFRGSDSLFDLVRDSKGEVIRRYIHRIPDKNFNYTQYTFNWFRYLKTLPFIGEDADGNLFLKEQVSQKSLTEPNYDSLTQLASTNKPWRTES
jgi:adenylate cyclase